MQKKLLALAVAGALTAPAAAIAQSSVTIYGTMSYGIDVRQATGGDSAITPVAGTTGTSSLRAAGVQPALTGSSLGAGYVTGVAGAAGVADLSSRTSTTGSGSNFGIRVREDLGGGMYTWMQAELSIAGTAVSPVSAGSGGTGPTYRNTGLALGSKAWGDIVFGMWDTPFNVNMNPAPQHAPYSNATTSFSSQEFGGGPWGGSQTNSGQRLDAVCTSALSAGVGTTFTNTAQACIAQAFSFHRRMSNTLQYWSPTWSGFQLKVVYQDEQLKQASNLVNGTATLTPKAWGGSLTYSAGPLYAGIGYERHDDYIAFAARNFNPTVGGGGFYFGGQANTTAFIPGAVGAGAAGVAGSSSSRDTAWNFNARYTFGAFTLGAYYERLKWTVGYQGILQGGEITELRKRAWGLEGAFVTGPHTIGIRYAKANNLEGSTQTGTVAGQGGTFEGGGTGNTSWIFGYAYSLSKRTSAFLYHTRSTNDTNARYQGVVFFGLGPAAGGDPRYTGIGLRHTF